MAKQQQEPSSSGSGPARLLASHARLALQLGYEPPKLAHAPCLRRVGPVLVPVPLLVPVLVTAADFLDDDAVTLGFGL